MRKLDNVPGLVDLLMVTFPLMSGVSEYSTASGDCSPKSFGGEQDTVESLDDTVDLLGRYTQVMPFLRQYEQFFWPSHCNQIVLVTSDSAARMSTC